MKKAADFRSIARDALREKWAIAVIAGLIAVLLGGVSASGPEIKLDISDSGAYINFSIGDQVVYSTGEGVAPELEALLVGGVTFAALAALVMSVALFILGSIIELGYGKFNLDLIDRQQQVDISTLFGYFTHWKTAAVSRLLQVVYVFAWSLLFIFPGIVAGYSYAMTGYILAEHPELTASEAIHESKEMMSGNRWRLFCLQISFIGWDILSALTFGIGSLWLTPYKQAATAAFYREVSATERTARPYTRPEEERPWRND